MDLSDVVTLGSPKGIDHPFYDELSSALAREVRACGDKVPVITGKLLSNDWYHISSNLIRKKKGYFGAVPGGLLDRIGRGYTDLCAALVAVGLQAEELQVWKEVDGIFTADPRKVPTARLLSAITPAEAAELTFYGSEVRRLAPFPSHPIAETCRSSTPSRWSK